ncbi:MAG: C45 family autoproteolytic acyltransferase/hydrolase [Candidatus Lokiarchaeota archaeon]|jgi:hypothetical protein
MKHRKTSLYLFIIMCFTASFGIIGSVNACNLNNYSYAEWRSSNEQPYLYVQADNYYTLGYLEGQNLAFQTAYMKLMIMLQAEQLGLDYDTAVCYSLPYLEFFPEDYLLEMQGIADGIDYVSILFMNTLYNITIDFLDILAQNCFWDVYYGQIIPLFSGYPQPPIIAGGCTALASRSEKFSRTVFGQHVDLTYLMSPTISFVYSKINGKKIFSFRTGSMLAMGGVNKYGIAISDNLLEVLNVGCVGKPVSVIYRTVLENAKNVWQAQEIVISNDFTLGWNYIIRGRRYITAIETIPNSYSSKVNMNGYTFDANIYENSLFKLYMIYPTKYLERYSRISELCQIYSQNGNLDMEDVFNVFKDPLISRRFTTGDPLQVGTVAGYFVDTKNNIHFCLGNSADSEIGVIRRF